MITLVQSNDPVRICFIEALLKDARIRYHILDAHMSILEGSIGILPRRICVAQGDIGKARDVLNDAGLGTEQGDSPGKPL